MGIEFYAEIGEEGTIKIPSSLKTIIGKTRVRVILRPIEENNREKRKIGQIIHSSRRLVKHEKNVRIPSKMPEGWKEFEKLCDEISGKIKPWSREELHEL